MSATPRGNINLTDVRGMMKCKLTGRVQPTS
jgi:hypothetical protein